METIFLTGFVVLIATAIGLALWDERKDEEFRNV